MYSPQDQDTNRLSFKDFMEQLTQKKKQLPQLQKIKSVNTLQSITVHTPQTLRYKSIQIEKNLNTLNTFKTAQQTSYRSTDESLPRRFKTVESMTPTPYTKINGHFKQTKRKGTQSGLKANLIRNSELFNDVIRKSEKIQRFQKQFTHSEILPTDKLISRYLKELAKKRQIQQKPQGEDAILEYEANLVYQEIVTDKWLKGKFQQKPNNNIKSVVKILLSTGYDQSVYYDLPRLRSQHMSLNLKRIHFFRFKYHFMTKFISMNVGVDKLFKGCERIENMRPYVLNEKMEYDVYGGDSGINLCSNLMYEKIFADCTLAPYFEGIDLLTQARKFARLFYQLIQHLDSPNYTNEVLRERHVKYNLTNVHLTNFKLYLSRTLDELGIPYKYKRTLLRRMDIYKYSIINKDCLQFIINQYGYQNFIEQFVKSCSVEPLLYDLIQKRGKQKFTAHCENIFHYFFRYNVKAITRDDIEQIHRNKTIISEKIYLKLKEKAIAAVSLLTQDRILLEDFDEDWDEIKPLVLSQCKDELIKSMGGQSMIIQWAQMIQFEMYSRHLNQIYDHDEINMHSNLVCKLNLLLYSVKFYKRTDLEVLHRRLRITEAQYFDFQQSFKVVFIDYPQFSFIHDLISQYKKYIVYD